MGHFPLEGWQSCTNTPRPSCQAVLQQFLSAVCSGLTFHTTQEFLLHSFTPLCVCTGYKFILHILLTQKEVEFKEIGSKDSLSLHAFGLWFDRVIVHQKNNFGKRYPCSRTVFSSWCLPFRKAASQKQPLCAQGCSRAISVANCFSQLQLLLQWQRQLLEMS